MGKVHGVLTDYDLASWVSPLTRDYTKTSQQRTGTPPFMAYGLLDGSDPVHLYRHDVESIFYIILILATHYEIQAPKGTEGGGVRIRQGHLQFQDWFEISNYAGLSAWKSDFFTRLKRFEVSPSFKGLRGWLRKLHRAFQDGFAAANRNQSLQEAQTEDSGDEDALPPFDWETLGGHITYSALIQPVRGFTGELEGLAIRYDPTSRIPPSTTGVESHA